MKKKKQESLIFPVHIHGIFDKNKQEIVKVTLDKDEIDIELGLESSDSALVACEFSVTLVL